MHLTTPRVHVLYVCISHTVVVHTCTCLQSSYTIACHTDVMSHRYTNVMHLHLSHRYADVTLSDTIMRWTMCQFGHTYMYTI